MLDRAYIGSESKFFVVIKVSVMGMYTNLLISIIGKERPIMRDVEGSSTSLRVWVAESLVGFEKKNWLYSTRLVSLNK